MKIGFDTRRVVVKAHRHVSAIQHFFCVICDRGIVGANICRRSHDDPIRTLGLGVFSIFNGDVGVTTGYALIKLHLASLHLCSFGDDHLALISTEHRNFTSRPHEKNGFCTILLMPMEKRAEAFDVNRSIAVHRGYKRDERSLRFDVVHFVLHCLGRALKEHNELPTRFRLVSTFTRPIVNTIY